MDMEKIRKTDKIFDFDNNDTRLCSYFGWEFNNSHAFYNYVIGYKKAADAGDIYAEEYCRILLENYN